MERHQRAQSRRGGGGPRPRAPRAPARYRALGDLQLQGDAAISRRPSSARTSSACSAIAPTNISRMPDFWRARVHPDDIARVEAEQALLFERDRHTAEYRFRKKDGTYCWVSDEQHLIRDEDGEPFEIVGSWSDITDRKEAEAAEDAARARLSASARKRAGGDLQLQGQGRLRADLRQREHQASARLLPGEISGARRFLAEQRAPRGSCRGRGRAGASCSRRAATPPSTASASGTANTSGSATSNICCAATTASRSRSSAHGAISPRASRPSRPRTPRAPASTCCCTARRPWSTASRQRRSYAPTFVSDNIKRVLGYEPDQYLKDPDFWRARVHPEDLAAGRGRRAKLFEEGRHVAEYRFRKKPTASIAG